MADQPMRRLHLVSDEALEDALRAMADEIAWPVAAPTDGAPDVATLVAARLDGTRRAAPGTTRWRPYWTWRPATRALVIALVVLLALAALVGAAGLGLPGLRIIFGGPEPSPTSRAVPSGSEGAGAVGSSRPSARTVRRRRRPSPVRPAPVSGSGWRSTLRRSTPSPVSMYQGRRTGRSGRRMRPGSTPPTTIRSRCVWASSGDVARNNRRPASASSRWRSGKDRRGLVQEDRRRSDEGRDRHGERPPRLLDQRRTTRVLLRGPERLRGRAAPLGRRCPPLVRRSDHIPARDLARTRCGHRRR